MRIVNGLVFCEDGAFHPLEVETQGDRIAACLLYTSDAADE